MTRGASKVRTLHAVALLSLLSLALVGSAEAVKPERPPEGKGSNFYLLAGTEYLEYHLDPRGCDEFVAAGLDPTLNNAGAVFGLGWVFHHPLRLGFLIGGWQPEVDREGIDCYLGRAMAELHLAVVESNLVGLEASFYVGGSTIVYDGLPDEEVLVGSETGLGLTGRLDFVGPLGLEIGYRWFNGRYHSATLEMPDGESITVHPTASGQSFRFVINIDI